MFNLLSKHMARLDQVTEGGSWQSGSWFTPGLTYSSNQGKSGLYDLHSATFRSPNKVTTNGPALRVQGRVMSPSCWPLSLPGSCLRSLFMGQPSLSGWLLPHFLWVALEMEWLLSSDWSSSQESGRYVLKLGKVIIGSINVACRTSWAWERKESK